MKIPKTRVHMSLRDTVQTLALRHYNDGPSPFGPWNVCGGCGRDWPCVDRLAIDGVLAMYPVDDECCPYDCAHCHDGCGCSEDKNPVE